MNAPDWLAAYAEKLGIPAPTKDELKAVLDLAGVAAHSSQRIAAPVATWLAGRAGLDLDEAMRRAQQVPTDSADSSDSPDGESDG
jgi:ribosomal protein L12E/L44/L45/RPP1/RPP2